jgi:hypothetical protein
MYGKFFIISKGEMLMKHLATKDTVALLHKIESIEKEVSSLKLSVLKKLTPTGKKAVTLKGILKDLDISEKDIAAAKKSLYSEKRMGSPLKNKNRKRGNI